MSADVDAASVFDTSGWPAADTPLGQAVRAFAPHAAARVGPVVSVSRAEAAHDDDARMVAITLPAAPVANDTPPSSPDPAVVQAVLCAASQVFRLERMASGVAAVVFGFVRRWKLYEAAGYESMRAYADAQLGVRGESNYKHYARASEAMWTHFAPLACRALESIAGGRQLYPSPELPAVPPVSVLRELPRALRRLAASEHPVVLERIERGEITFEELRYAGRPAASSNGEPKPEDPATSDERAQLIYQALLEWDRTNGPSRGAPH